MSSAILNPLEQLLRLDASSPGFHDQLSNILYGNEYKDWVKHIKGDDLVGLVDYLDGAFSALEPASSSFRKCQQELRDICGEKSMLPTSYILPSPDLTTCDQPSTSGGFGDIYQGELKGSKVCVKRVRMYSQCDSKKTKKAFYQEAVMWNHLTHKNIVSLLGITETPLQLVSEWMPGGTLAEYVKKRPDANLCNLLSDVAEGLCFLHYRNIVHGDLKGPNILMDESDHARVTDFGLAKVTQNLDSNRILSEDRGHSPRWAAPEVLKGGQFSKEADVFSFAMVMIEVFTGAVPFDPQPSSVAILEIMRGNRPAKPLHGQLTNELWELMQHCWKHDPYSRQEASGILRALNGTVLPPTKAGVGDHCIDEQRTRPSEHIIRKPSRHDTATSELSAVVLDPAQPNFDQLQKPRGNPVDGRADMPGDRSGPRGDVGNKDSSRGHKYDLGINDKGEHRPGRDPQDATYPSFDPAGMHDKGGPSRNSSRADPPGNLSREHLVAPHDQSGTNPRSKGKNAGVHASSQAVVRDPPSDVDHRRLGEQRGQSNLGRPPSQMNTSASESPNPPPTDLHPHGRDEQWNQVYPDVRGARNPKYPSLGRDNPAASRSVPYLNETHNLDDKSWNFSSAELLEHIHGDISTRPGKSSNDLPGGGIGGYERRTTQKREEGYEGSKGVRRGKSGKDPEKTQQDTDGFAAVERRSPDPPGSTPAVRDQASPNPSRRSDSGGSPFVPGSNGDASTERSSPAPISPTVSNTKNAPVNRSRATENTQFGSQTFDPPDGGKTGGTVSTPRRHEGLDEVPKKKWWQCCC